jgi:hypothetical protein
MDIKEQLLNLFDTEAGVYALHIIPSAAFGYGVSNPNMPETYSGVHFVDTASLLSIRQEAPELISVNLNEDGEVVEPGSGEHIETYFESVELGIWCKALLSTGDATMMEHTDIPFLMKRDDFTEFERLAKASLSRLTTLWCAEQAQHHAQTLMSARLEPPLKLNNAFYGYYSVLQGIVLARTGKFVHEAASFIDVAPDVASLYTTVLERMMDGDPLSRRELSAAHFEILKLMELLATADGESELPDEPSEEIVKSMDKELLRLRRALL